MPFNGDWEALRDRSKLPECEMTCESCHTTYNWYWEGMEEAWWPGHAEWWYTDKHEFLCSKRCWQAVQEDKK